MDFCRIRFFGNNYLRGTPRNHIRNFNFMLSENLSIGRWALKQNDVKHQWIRLGNFRTRTSATGFSGSTFIWSVDSCKNSWMNFMIQFKYLCNCAFVSAHKSQLVAIAILHEVKEERYELISCALHSSNSWNLNWRMLKFYFRLKTNIKKNIFFFHPKKKMYKMREMKRHNVRHCGMTPLEKEYFIHYFFGRVFCIFLV